MHSETIGRREARQTGAGRLRIVWKLFIHTLHWFGDRRAVFRAPLFFMSGLRFPRVMYLVEARGSRQADKRSPSARPALRLLLFPKNLLWAFLGIPLSKYTPRRKAAPFASCLYLRVLTVTFSHGTGETRMRADNPSVMLRMTAPFAQKSLEKGSKDNIPCGCGAEPAKESPKKQTDGLRPYRFAVRRR